MLATADDATRPAPPTAAPLRSEGAIVITNAAAADPYSTLPSSATTSSPSPTEGTYDGSDLRAAHRSCNRRTGGVKGGRPQKLQSSPLRGSRRRS
jgi:hypothetical protein